MGYLRSFSPLFCDEGVVVSSSTHSATAFPPRSCQHMRRPPGAWPLLAADSWRWLQVLAEMLELAQGFQDTTHSTNLEVWVVILVAACLILSVVQVLGVIGIFGKFVGPSEKPS